MTMNNNNLPSGQSEYRYREDQPGEYAEAPSQQAINAQMVKSRMKRMMVPVILMFVVYIVYHGLTWYAGRKQNVSVEQQQKAVPKPMVIPAKPKSEIKAAPIATVPTDQNLSSQVTHIEDSMREQLGLVNQQISDNRDQITRINDAISQNQTDINDIKQSINMLNASVLKIAEDMAKLTKPKKVKKVPKVKAKPTLYHVVAIVPGRAWLETSEGNTITVRTGDKLGGYGTVDVISSRQGMVITSSGKIIQYGVNDI